MIPGPKLNQVFASRWKALFWAGSILLTAYCTVPKQGEKNEDVAPGVAEAVGVLGGGAQSSASSTSPWAPDPPAPADTPATKGN
jgi:hypothetical protein